MVTTDDLKKLASLSRISVPEEDVSKFTKEFEAIIAYVGQLESLDLGRSDLPSGVPAVRNVFRADENPTEPGTWTEKLVGAFPEREGNSLVVKQIITHA